MRKIIFLSLVCLCFWAGTATAAEVKIAVFDLQKVARECDAMSEAKTAIEGKFGKDKAKLEAQKQELEALLKNKNATDAQQVETRLKQQQYTEDAQAFVRILQADEMRVRMDIDTVINAAVKEIQKKKKYSVIFDSSLPVAFDESLDITNDVLTEANLFWKNKIKGAKK